MRRVVLLCLAALAVAPTAHAGGPYMLVGAADDVVLGKDAPAKLQLAKLAGLDTIRVTAQWTRGQTALPDGAQAAFHETVAAAKLAGIRIVLSIYPYGSSQTPVAQDDRTDFANYAASIAKSELYVHDFIVGNEPNLNRFWLPQYGPSGEDAAAVAYTGLLAETYDAIKAVRPRTTVYGGALAPRGSDRPGTIRDTHSPTRFIEDMGAAYRELGRTTPIMDAFAFHPYADASNIPPTATHPRSTSIGIADYDKLVALLGEAFDFDGSGQRGSTLPILYDEFGVEALVPAAKESLYTGNEPATVHPVDEATQAQFYNEALQLAFCQKTVMGVLLFHFVDEPGRAAWQSGVYYVDGTPKTSIDLVRNAADSTRRGIVAECPDLKATPKLRVSASATKVELTTTLDATYTLTLQRLGGKAPKVVLTGDALGRRTTTVRVTQELPKGRYRWKLAATATENAGPPGVAFSKTFRVA